MKKTFLLGIFALLIFLAGCLPQEKEAPTYDCSTSDYYSNVIVNKEVIFLWDSENNWYMLEIPELCIRFFAQPRDKERDLEERKDNLFLDLEKKVIVKNNTLTVNGNKYWILDKKAEEDLDTAVWKEFLIRPKLEDIYTHLDEKYCVIDKNDVESTLYARPQIAGVADEESHYTLIRMIDLDLNVIPSNGEESALESYGYYNANFCWSLYPTQGVRFDETKPYGILYTEKYPTRYFIYPELIGQGSDLLWENIVLDYVDL